MAVLFSVGLSVALLKLQNWARWVAIVLYGLSLIGTPGRVVTTHGVKLMLLLHWYRDKPDGWVLGSGLWSPLYVPFSMRPSGRLAGLVPKGELMQTATVTFARHRRP